MQIITQLNYTSKYQKNRKLILSKQIFIFIVAHLILVFKLKNNGNKTPQYFKELL